MTGPVETKVQAATVASAVSGLGLWALQTYVFHGEVPLPVLAAVQVVVPAVVTFVAGWLAPHTPRPDLSSGPLLDPHTGVFIPQDEEPSGRHVLDDLGVPEEPTPPRSS